MKNCENCKWYNGITRRDRDARTSHTLDGNVVLYPYGDGKCFRFPKHEEVLLESYCGEHQDKLKSK